ncbi:MAG: TonB-dependent receptor [Hydrocarboniphaga sp.]|uniref:TonB-dependent receptor n=1 Tax=Hydrocarboniphaga sp. TaxID=2033016 RepID=UPI0026167101|nr:TonB-dependent receptor [Hydrocarboniphaga sp.]MDB5969742.1 TonB-dependent receptor [Hydrocarboniphaga sp.]
MSARRPARRRAGHRAAWLALGLLPLTTASAQDEAASLPLTASSDAPAERPMEIETVVVTATKTARDAQDVPVSLTTVDGEFIRQAGLASFNDLQNYAANLNITVAGNSGTLGVRGFATPDLNPSFDPSVGTVVDGVYYGRSAFLSAFFFDIDRLEVLRGPQGTLFGKNTTAGLLNLSTNTARSSTEAVGDFTGSSYGRRSIQPAFNVALGDGWSSRLAGNATYGDEGSQYNTDLERGESNPSQRTARARIGYDGAGPFHVDLGGFYSHQFRNYNLFAFDHVGPNMLALAQTYDPLAEADASNHTNSENHPSRDDADLYGGHVTVDFDPGELWRMNKATVTSVTAYAGSTEHRDDLDADFSPIPFIVDQLVKPSRYQQISEELRLAGETPDLFGWGYGVSFVTGFFLFDSHYTTSDLFLVEDLGAAAAYEVAAQADAQLAGRSSSGSAGRLFGALAPPLGQILDVLSPLTAPVIGQQVSAAVGLDQHTQSYAYFGQFEHRVLEDLSIIGGLRFGYERKTADAYSHTNSPLIPLITNGAQKDHDTRASQGDWDLSPKAGLKYEPNKALTAYFTWAQGYKSGGFNGRPLSAENLEYQPELATSYEIGAKTRARFFGMPVQFNIAAFTTTFEDLQVSTFQDGSFVILNAASARSSGFEGDFTWMPLQGMLLSSSFGYADAHYVKYENAPAISSSGEDSQDLGGRPLELAPKWTASFVPAYLLPLPGPIHVTVGGDLLYRSQRYLDVDDDPAKLQKATLVYNARVTAATPAEGWTLTFAGHNLSDVAIYNQALSQPLAPGNSVRWMADYGRFYTLDLTIRL